jgi:DNA-binding transcriptional ArsR family regulator
MLLSGHILDGDLDILFHALADRTRRAILDLLRKQARTTGELAQAFPKLSRFAVMKHLGVLEEAGLVIARREGRQRWNHLNAVPLRQMYERWVRPYESAWAGSMLNIKRAAEGGDGPAPAPEGFPVAKENRDEEVPGSGTGGGRRVHRGRRSGAARG